MLYFTVLFFILLLKIIKKPELPHLYLQLHQTWSKCPQPFLYKDRKKEEMSPIFSSDFYSLFVRVSQFVFLPELSTTGRADTLLSTKMLSALMMGVSGWMKAMSWYVPMPSSERVCFMKAGFGISRICGEQKHSRENCTSTILISPNVKSDVMTSMGHQRAAECECTIQHFYYIYFLKTLSETISRMSAVNSRKAEGTWGSSCESEYKVHSLWRGQWQAGGEFCFWWGCRRRQKGCK